LFNPLFAEDTGKYSSHVLRFQDEGNATYIDGQGDRYVDYRLPSLEAGSSSPPVLISFMCRNSCDKAAKKSGGRYVDFELLREDTMQVVGSRDFLIRICASPMRDLEHLLAKKVKREKVSSGVGAVENNVCSQNFVKV
jgi:hypothetical protein